MKNFIFGKRTHRRGFISTLATGGGSPYFGIHGISTAAKSRKFKRTETSVSW